MHIILKEKILYLFTLTFAVWVGCSKSGDNIEAADTIRFEAETGVADTRTAYSGQGTVISGVLTKERINWIVGDQFTIWSDKAKMLDGVTQSANYYVTSITNPDEIHSRAEVEHVDPNGLQWGGTTEDYTFYARYPADKTRLNASTMTASIPPSQTMIWDSEASTTTGHFDLSQYGFMFAKSVVSASADAVRLNFYPMFTAFQFTVGPGENSRVTLTSFTLSSSSDQIAGNFEIACASFNGSATDLTTYVTATESDKKSITVNLSGTEAVTAANPLTIMVVALPKDLTNLSVTFTGTPIGTRTLDLNQNGSPITFTGRKKYIISDISFPSVLGVTWDGTIEGEGLEWTTY